MLKNKKILLVVFVLLLLIIMPTMVKAATIEATETTSTSTGAVTEWSYELEGDNITNLKCTNVSSVTGELTIPSTIDGHTVTNIGLSAFRNCAGLRDITIPNSVTSIGFSAFENCTGLTSITIPNSVTSIAKLAFFSCSGIKSVTLSNNLTKLDDSTFAGCSGITEIALPENLTTIGYAALGCANLKFVKIPESVVSIDDIAFGRNTENLTIYGKEGSTAQTFAESKNINFEKIENWDNRNSNSGSDITCPTVSSMKIKYSNIMDYYNQTTNDFRVPSGVEIAIIVEFSETLNGTQTPTLTIKCGTGENIELKNGVLSGKNIVYTYKIQKNDEGLITAIKLEGGNISDNDGNEAKLSVKEITVQYNNSAYAYANGSVEGTTSQTDNSNNNTDKSSGSTTNNGSSTNSKKDTTTAKTVLPYTGKVILVWIIAIVAVSAVVAHVRYKKLYIK